jgi:hypothetical protein
MKPGIKTSEFWLTLLVNVALATAAVIDDGPLFKVATVVSIALTTMGYGASRAVAKKAAPVFLVALLFLPGCWTVQAFDQDTINSIDTAMKAENEDFVLTRKALEKANAGPVALNSHQIRSQSKMQFFRDWRWAENQKTKVSE